MTAAGPGHVSGSRCPAEAEALEGGTQGGALRPGGRAELHPEQGVKADEASGLQVPAPSRGRAGGAEVGGATLGAKMAYRQVDYPLGCTRDKVGERRQVKPLEDTPDRGQAVGRLDQGRGSG